MSEREEVVGFENTYRPVEDADPSLVAGLRRILARLPEGRRQIDVDRGWHSLIVRLDETLAEIEPECELRQVKQKLGGLRYYATRSELPCCAAWRQEAGVLEGRAWTARQLSWRSEHYDTPEHQEHLRVAALDEWGAAIRAAEAEALVTCERCGRQPAELLEGGDGPYLATVCPRCARRLGYHPRTTHHS